MASARFALRTTVIQTLVGSGTSGPQSQCPQRQLLGLLSEIEQPTPGAKLRVHLIVGDRIGHPPSASGRSYLRRLVVAPAVRVRGIFSPTVFGQLAAIRAKRGPRGLASSRQPQSDPLSTSD